MQFVKVKNHNRIVLDEPKAILLNEYNRSGDIKILDSRKNHLTIEIISDNPIIKNSILK